MSDIFAPRFLRQKAVYWAPAGNSEYGNEQLFATPIEIKCRWDESGVIFINRDQKEETSKSEVMVDRDLEELGVLRLGLLSEITDLAASPFDYTEAWQIKKFAKIPNPQCNKYVRTAYL